MAGLVHLASILLIAEQRMSRMAELYTYLVRSARVQLDQDKTYAFRCLEHRIIQNGFLGSVRPFGGNVDGVGFASLYSMFTSRPEVFAGTP